MRDFAPCRGLTPRVRDARHFETAVRAYTTIQRWAVDHLDRVIATGCPVLDLSVLPAVLRAMVADDEAMMRGHPRGLDDSTVRSLNGLCEYFEGVCEELAGLGLPPTIVNTDLSHGNIAVHRRSVKLFDWAESAVTDPLGSLRQLAFDLPRDGRLRQRLWPSILERYIEAWTDFASPGALKRGYAASLAAGFVINSYFWQKAWASLPADARFCPGQSDPSILGFAVSENMKRLLRWWESHRDREWALVM
jgi:hypothetical protein